MSIKVERLDIILIFLNEIFYEIINDYILLFSIFVYRY